MLAVAACLAAASASADDGAPAAVRYEVFPPAAQLDSARDRQRIVVRRIEPSGVTRDVTEAAALAAADPAVFGVESGVLMPVADGESTLQVLVEGATLAIPVVVQNVAQTWPLTFRLDILPELTRAGCNNGSCHGSARGRDGFHLSLFGYDPDSDYLALTRELPGRRLNLAAPGESLVLTKASGSVPHTGGERIGHDDPGYEVVKAWIRSGAPPDPADLTRVVGIEIYPPNIVLETPAGAQGLVVRARYADGTDRDVTRLAVLMSNNDVSARIDGTRVTAQKRGEAQVLARFDAYTVATQVIVIPADAPAVEALPPAANYIDTHVHEKLRTLRIRPSEVCGDAEFLRRAHLDVVGVLPNAEEYERFMADADPAKRARLIDALLERKEFVEIWVMKWAERLQMRSTNEVSYKATLLFYNWLQERIAGNVPINRIVRELLDANGGTFTDPASNYYQIERDTLKLSENVAQVFIGARIQCAQCHNHPFDRWTMDDYYGFAAFFSQIGRKTAEDPRETIIFNSGSGEVKHPVGGREMRPKFLGGEAPDLAGRDRREALAEWMTAPDNRLFARNVANFVWAHFLGRGIIEPVDDVRVSNPAANDALLDALADQLVAYDYDMKRFVRDICNSRTYQLATRTNETNAADERNFSHAAVRRIRAEVLLDAITAVTGTKNKFPGLPLGARAVQISDGNVSTYFLTTFGRAKRETVCSCEVVMEPSLSQALHLINGDTINQKIAEGGRIRKELEAGRSPDQILEGLYLSCLTRPPTAEERAAVLGALPAEGDPAPALEDAFWALLNSKEFIFNH